MFVICCDQSCDVFVWYHMDTIVPVICHIQVIIDHTGLRTSAKYMYFILV